MDVARKRCSRVAMGALALAGLLAAAASAAGQTAGEEEGGEGLAGVLELGVDAPEMGAREAPIVMVEVVDFRCLFCAEQATTALDAIIERYVDPGIVRYVILDFPLARHAEAERDAAAARCAGEQGAYLRAHRALLTGEGLARNGPLDLAAFAGVLGIDASALAECVESGRHVAAVRDGAERAVAVRVDGTPTFLFGFPRGDEGRTVEIVRALEGAVGLEPVVEAIEALRELVEE